MRAGRDRGRRRNPSSGSAQVTNACAWPAPIGQGYNTYKLKNTAGQADPSLGEVTGGGEIEDYPITFTADCNPPGTLGPSTVCLSAESMLSSVTATTLGHASLQLAPPPTSLHDPVSASQTGSPGYISVNDYSLWPQASINDAKSWFYIKVADGSGDVEIMQVLNNSIFSPYWQVTRDAQNCTGAPSFAAGALVTIADRCQCQIDAGITLPSGILNVTASDPGLPCFSPPSPVARSTPSVRRRNPVSTRLCCRP